MNSPQAVPFYRHSLGPGDAARIAEVLSSPFLTSAGTCRSVEAQLCEYFSIAGAKLTNSWTNGAIATLMAMNIGPGDEVIVPAMTFVATANVVELVGAKPVFVDVSPGTLLIDIDKVAAAIGPRTRAVIPVHLYGQMADIAALRRTCGPNIAIIEDSAHCFEGTRNGERPGVHSDAAVFSFYATKNVTCGEGGAVISSNLDFMQRLQETVLHGMSAGAEKRFEGALYRHWDMSRLGTKANLPDILAALLPDQIESVGEKREAREQLAQRYHRAFKAAPGVITLAREVGCISAQHLFPIALPLGSRDQILSALNKAGIGSTVNYRSVPSMQYYSNRYRHEPDAFPVSAAWGDRTISLPLYPKLTETEQDHVIQTALDLTSNIKDA